MAIKRRVRAERSEDKGRLRHPLLKHGTVHLSVYNYIKANPGAGRRELAHLTASGQPMSDLMREGLITPISEKPYKYRVVQENETGKARDKVQVNIAVFVNKFGEFSAVSELVGQKPTATEDFPQLVAYREVTIPIPHREDPYAIREIIDINARPEGHKEVVYTPDYDGDLTIEGSWTKITPEQ